jgi:hypothetical protein
MTYDKEKIDKYALELLYLGVHGRLEGYGASSVEGI